MIDATAIGLRALGYLGTLQAAGLFLFLLAFRDGVVEALPAIRRLARATVAVAFLAVVAEQAVQPARLAGVWSGIADLELHRIWLESAAGNAAVVRLAGLALAGVGLANPSRLGAVVGTVGAAAVLASFMMTGHTATHAARPLLAVLLSVHSGIVAFWLGALPALRLASKLDPAPSAGRLVAAFSRSASMLVPLILLSGLGIAFYLLPSLDALGTPYGLMLVLKVGGFTALIGLAALNKWRFGPRLAAGSAAAALAFRRGVALEWLLIAAVLTVTATMTMLFSPD